jgi:3-oxo-4,17-pregnadiene-20-carboxyl-CoA hydratase alpha subunit
VTDVVNLKDFFAEVREGRLTGIRCTQCRELSIPPKEFCGSCGKRAWESVLLAGDGTISSYTVIRVAPRGHAGETPYAVAVVRLTEGVSLLGRVTGLPLESLRVGLPVRFRPLVTGTETVIGFGPA